MRGGAFEYTSMYVFYAALALYCQRYCADLKIYTYIYKRKIIHNSVYMLDVVPLASHMKVLNYKSVRSKNDYIIA